MVKEYTLHLFSIEYHDHGDDTRKNETYWAEDEEHAVSMFYTRFDDCSVVRVNKLLGEKE